MTRWIASGIDEAGYGPLLGPLVVARTDFSTEGSAGPRRHPRRSKAIVIGDSKQVLVPKNGFRRLEATVLGFAPDIDREMVQHLPDEGGVLTLDTGAILLPDATPRAVRRAARTALRAFAILARADLDTVMRMRLDAETRREVNALVEDFLRYHVEDAYPSRSDKIIGQLLGDT